MITIIAITITEAAAYKGSTCYKGPGRNTYLNLSGLLWGSGISPRVHGGHETP